MSRDTLVRLCLTWMCLTLYSKILKNGTLKINIKLNPVAVRRAKIVYNFGLSECIRVKEGISQAFSTHEIKCASIFW